MDARAEWPQLTVISGMPGAGKSHLARTTVRPDRSIWISLRDQHDVTELAPRLIRRLRPRVPTLPSWLSAAVAPAAGPVSNADPLRRAEQLGSLIGQELGAAMHRVMYVVLDDLEQLDGEPTSIRLIESLVRTAPEPLSIVMCTRTAVPFAVSRLRSDSRVREIGADELTLDNDDARALIHQRWPGIADSTDGVVEISAGNPGALLTVASLMARAEPAQRSEILDELPDGDPADLAVAATRRHYAALDSAQRELLDDVCVLGRTTATELTHLGHLEAAGIVRELADAALLEPEPGTDDHLRLSRLATDVVEPDPDRATERAADAVRAAVGRGDPRAALVAARRHGAHDLLYDTLVRFGAAVVDTGSGQLVLDAIADLDEPDELRGIAGRAAQALGDRDRALREYERAAATEVRPGDAWRQGLIEHYGGDIRAAAQVYQRGIDARRADDPPAELARLLGYAGSVAWLMGEAGDARDRARESLELATTADDDGALAVAFTLAALVAASDGDRVNNDWNYVRALQHAERANDLVQIARIRTNRGSRLLEEAEYEAALDELDHAVRYAEVCGFDTMLALALTNRGEVTTKLGRLDDAHTDLTTATELLKRQGTNLIAYPLVQLARLYTTRGDLEQARGFGEQALATTEQSSDRQIEVGALNQLAKALSDLDPEAAWELAQRAVGIGAGSLDAAESWTIVARLALDRGDNDASARAATSAIELARSRHDRYALASALEVSAATKDDASERRRCLDEAFTLFEELGCAVDAGRVEIELATQRLDGPAIARIAAIADQARRLGARPLLARAELVLDRHASGNQSALTVSTLGAFTVSVGGEPVPAKRWQSKKARDLFKMLVSLRGRPLPRESAVDRLWPDDPPDKAASKLSVALATTRSVLDPDKEFPPDHYVRAEADAIAIDPSTVPTDVDRFLRTAAAALDEVGRSRSDRAIAMLAAVEAQYTGDLFEDDPYVDWFVPLREEARAVYLNVTRELATIRASSGAIDDAIRLYLRLIEREPYDEHAHLCLVAALTRVGRHGDARRRYNHYVDRMRELDLEPRSLAVAPEYLERA